MNWLLFLTSTSLVVYTCLRIVGWALGRGDGWRVTFFVATLLPVAIALLLLGLGAVGLLAPLPVLVASAAMALASLPLRQRELLPQPDLAPRVSRPASFRLAAAMAILASALGILIWQNAVGGTDFASDDITYHASVPARWIVEQQLVATPEGPPAYYPLNSELFTMWFLLPFREDVLAGMSSLYWALLLALACVTWCRARGLGEATSLGTAGLVLSSYVVPKAANTFTGSDLAPVACIVAALVFLTEAYREDATAPRRWLIAGAGLMFGFAAGCKFSFVPYVVLAAAWVAVARVPGLLVSRRLPAFLLAAFVPCGFWYLRNLWLTGNPLFPAAVGPFDGPFTPEHQASTTLVHWLLHQGVWREAARALVGWPVSLFLLSVAGYVGVALRLRRSRSGIAVELLAALMGIAFALLFFRTPYSATYNLPGAGLAIDLRYVLLPFTLGILLFARWMEGRWAPLAWLAAPVAAAHGVSWLQNGLWVGVAGAALGAAWVFTRKPVGKRPLAFALTVSLAALIAWVPSKRGQTEDNLQRFAHGDDVRPWQALHQLPEGERVGLFLNPPHQYYPFFGRKYRLRPVRLTHEGMPSPMLHERWMGDPSKDWWKFVVPDYQGMDTAELISNIRATGLRYVAVSRMAGWDWPPQLESLVNHPETQALHQDESYVLLELRG